MLWLRISVALVALQIALIPLLRCQQSGDCQARSVIVGVRDARGSFVPELDAAAFRAELGNQDLKITSSTGQLSSSRLILLMDASGSMSRTAKWQVASAVANELVSEAPADARIGLALFAENVKELVPFTSERDVVIEKVRQLPEISQAERKGKSAIVDSIVRTADWFHKPQPGDAIYVITDGQDNASRTALQKAERILIARGVRVFIFVMGSQFLDADDQVHLDDFESLSRQTVGMAINYVSRQYSKAGSSEEWHDGTRTQDLLTSSTRTIDRAIWNYYLLRVELPFTLGKEHEMKLELLDKNKRKRKDVELAYPREFPSCAQP